MTTATLPETAPILDVQFGEGKLEPIEELAGPEGWCSCACSCSNDKQKVETATLISAELSFMRPMP